MKTSLLPAIPPPTMQILDTNFVFIFLFFFFVAGLIFCFCFRFFSSFHFVVRVFRFSLSEELGSASEELRVIRRDRLKRMLDAERERYRENTQTHTRHTALNNRNNGNNLIRMALAGKVIPFCFLFLTLGWNFFLFSLRPSSFLIALYLHLHFHLHFLILAHLSLYFLLFLFLFFSLVLFVLCVSRSLSAVQSKARVG